MTNHYLLLLLGGALVAFGLVVGLDSTRLGLQRDAA
jgi:hypothetical protein